MSQRSDKNSHYQDIVSYIESLYASRQLIAQAYCDGSIDVVEEHARSLRQLQQIRVMRNNVNREDSLRLSSVMMKMLDQAVHRVRSLRGSTNLGDHLARMFDLADGFQKAGIDNLVDEQEVYASDFDLAAYDVAEEMDVMLMHVDTMAHNNFANVASYSEKIRQNTFYLKEMTRLVEALSSLNDPVLIDLLESSLDLQPLYHVYNSHILNNMHKWRAKLLDIISHLEHYMHKIKEIEPKARRIRDFSMFLHRHPEYTPREVEDYPEIPDWAYYHAGFAIHPLPDVLNENLVEQLIPIAHAIERIESIAQTTRQGGTLVIDDDEPVVILELTPFERALHDLVSEVGQSPEPVSARDFFASHSLTKDIELRISLICLASLLDNSKKTVLFGFDALVIDRVLEPCDDQTIANLFIEDFVLCQKS